MVEFESKFNNEMQKQLDKHTFKKNSLMLGLFVVAIFVVCGICEMMVFDNIVLGVLMMAFGVICLPLIYVLLLIVKPKNKTMSIMSDETIQNFKFYEDKMVITQCRGEEYKGETIAKYSYLYRVEETKTHYFMYISNTMCHVVDKTTIKQGSVEELNTILINALGTKFKALNK